MDDKRQTQLLTVLSIAIFEGLKAPLSKLLTAKVPEKRGAREDAMDAVLQAVARMVAVMIASGLIRQLARQQR